VSGRLSTQSGSLAATSRFALERIQHTLGDIELLDLKIPIV